MHAWLKAHVFKYERVAETLFAVLKVLKRQERLYPAEYKEFVYQFLWHGTLLL